MANPLITISEYLPGMDALLTRVNMERYLIDYYLHRKQCTPTIDRMLDEKLKDLIGAFAVHLTLHPSPETHAWTVHMVAEQPYTLFVTGSAGGQNEAAGGFIVGHVLTENIRHTDVNSFHAQFTDNSGRMFKSFVRCESSEVARMVECFYQQSEQLPLRLEISDSSDTAVALSGLPGYDSDWFSSVELAKLAEASEISKKPMRTCEFTFTCDCSPEKLLPYFRSVTASDLNELYGDDEELLITCPRCGRQFPIARALIEGDD